MENTTQINEKIAKNLIYYRKAAGLTQAELAERINYSDKSVSKWEQGNAVPDIYILLRLSKLYKVTLNELVGEDPPPPAITQRKKTGLHLLIMLLSCGIVWLVATFAFAILQFVAPGGVWWLCFLYALPVCAILLIVYGGIWKYRALNFISVSLLVWTAITCLYLTLYFALRDVYDLTGLWCIFLVGIPLQLLAIFWGSFRTLSRRLKSGVAGKKQPLPTENSAEEEKKE